MRTWGLLGTLLAVGCSTQTICATDDALAVDPTLNESIAAAVDYWAERGMEGLTAVDGSSCDVPVRMADLDGKRVGQAMVREYLTGDCSPIFIELDPIDWTDQVVARDAQRRVMLHEVGHLHCYDDGEDGVMSSEWHH